MTVAGGTRSAPGSLPQQRMPDWAGDAIAITAVVLTALVPVPPQIFLNPGVRILTLVIALAPALILLLRRRWPLWILGACLLCFAAAAAIGAPSLGPGIAASIAAFNVANRTSRRIALIAGAIATALVAALSLIVSRGGPFDARVFEVAAAIAVATALGDSTRSRREYLIAVTERAERAEQSRESEAQRRVAEERLRIAQDLHDTVAHRISVISLNAGVASNALEDRPEKARESLLTIRAAARGVLSDIGELLRYLRTDEDDAVTTPPQSGLRQLDALVQRMSAAGLEVEAEIAGELSQITGTTDLVAYRVIQEGLTNAHKHGAGHRARLRISVEADALRIAIENPVAQAGANHPDAPGGGLGLTGIRERVAQLRGTVEALPTADAYRLTVALPLNEEEYS